MRYSLLAAALAVAMGSTSFSAAAADTRDQQIAELRAQLEAMQAKLLELEERTDAQSDVNLDTAAQLDKLNTGSPKIDTKGGIKVTSADGKFEATVGGRIHFDTYAFDRDLASTTGTTEFRRARLTLSGKAYGWDYLYEPDAAAVIDELLSRYIEALVYQAVAENMASEQSARMVAMKAATDNAGNLIGELKLVYNKTRQAAITKELSEIVSGAAAIGG